MLRPATLLTAGLVASCSPPIVFDLEQPLALTIDDDLLAQPLFDRVEVESILVEIATKLGTRAAGVTETTNPPIWLRFDNDCPALRGAYVDGEDEDTPSRRNADIYLCYAFLDRRYLWGQTLRHEIAHVMGARHLPCNGKNVLCPQAQTQADADVREYSADDLAEIERWVARSGR